MNKFICPIPKVNLIGKSDKRQAIKSIVWEESNCCLKSFSNKNKEIHNDTSEISVHNFAAKNIGSKVKGAKNNNTTGGYTKAVKND